MIHELKTINPYYNDVYIGVKTFEVRKNDRNFATGDVMLLREWEPKGHFYTGMQINCIITYVLDDEQYCKDGFVIIGFKRLFK